MAGGRPTPPIRSPKSRWRWVSPRGRSSHRVPPRDGRDAGGLAAGANGVNNPSISAESIAQWWGQRPVAGVSGEDRAIGAAIWNGGPREIMAAPDGETSIIGMPLVDYDCEVFVDGRHRLDRRLRRGEAQIMVAGVEPRAILKSDWRMLHVYLPQSLVAAAALDCGYTAPVTLIDPGCAHDPVLADILMRIDRELAGRAIASRLLLDSIGGELAVHLVRRWSDLSGVLVTSTLRGGLAPLAAEARVRGDGGTSGRGYRLGHAGRDRRLLADAFQPGVQAIDRHAAVPVAAGTADRTRAGAAHGYSDAARGSRPGGGVRRAAAVHDRVPPRDRRDPWGMAAGAAIVSGDIQAVENMYQLQAATVGGDKVARGLDQGWVAPVGVFDAAEGFGEEAWIEAIPVTVLATRLQGAAVTWCCGKQAGRISGASSTVLQCKGTPNDSRSAGPIRFAQVYLQDALIDRVADAIRPGAVISGALRDDLVFVPDRDLDHGIVSYVRATASGQARWSSSRAPSCSSAISCAPIMASARPGAPRAALRRGS